MSLMIYLIGSVDKLQTMVLVAAIISTVFMCVCLIASMLTTMFAGDALNPNPDAKVHISNDERTSLLVRAKALIGVRKAMPYVIICGLLCVFTPDSKTLVAAYVIPKVVNNEKLGSIVGNGADLINVQLSNWMAQVSSSVPAPVKEKHAHDNKEGK